MVRAPTTIPLDGRVDCTDSTEMPIAAIIGAVAATGAVAYAATNPELVIDTGGIYWGTALGSVALGLLEASGRGFTYADECRDAKRRGAELARRADVRGHAVALWKQATAAARVPDCISVRALDPQLRTLDSEFHAVVFMRDVAIARCMQIP